MSSTPDGAMAPKQPSLATRAATLARDFRELACDHLELAALEARRAGMGLSKMLAAAVIISMLIVSAWLALVSVGILWATFYGVSWPAAVALAALGNLLLAGLLALWIRGQTGELMFAATLRQLRRTTDGGQREAT